jgi:hypothetical protein
MDEKRVSDEGMQDKPCRAGFLLYLEEYPVYNA